MYYHRSYLLKKTCLGSVESLVEGLRLIDGVQWDIPQILNIKSF